MNIKDLIRPVIEDSLTRFGHEGDDLIWDTTYAAFPQPQGIMLLNYLVVSMKSGLLSMGQEYITTAMQIPDMLMLKDQASADRVIMQVLAALREIRAQMLTPTNGEGGPSLGTLKLPPHLQP